MVEAKIEPVRKPFKAYDVSLRTAVTEFTRLYHGLPRPYNTGIASPVEVKDFRHQGIVNRVSAERGDYASKHLRVHAHADVGQLVEVRFARFLSEKKMGRLRVRKRSDRAAVDSSTGLLKAADDPRVVTTAGNQVLVYEFVAA
jgi:hypothetical protein